MIDRWRIAIREAGHAVVARVLEINCGRCAISEDGTPVSFHSVTSCSSHEHVTGYRGRIIAERAG